MKKLLEPPTKPGLYLARHIDEETSDWPMIVEIEGSAPFLTMHVFDRGRGYSNITTTLEAKHLVFSEKVCD